MKDFLKRQIAPLLLCICLLFGLTNAYCIDITAANETAVSPQVSVGDGFMVALASDGSLYAWGSNFAGTLGNGTTSDNQKPVKVTSPLNTKFVSVSAGWNHVIALSSDGKVYTWGANGYGQLGIDSKGFVTTPKQVSLPTEDKVIAVAAGNSFSLALTSTGSVYAWGLNSFGQLGTSTDLTNRTEPQRIEALSEIFVTSICAGNTTGAAISADGKVWLWGDNQKGQLGSSAGDILMPVQKTSSASYFATQVALGDAHSSFVELNGSVKSMGTNLYGQFGNGQVNGDSPSLKLNGAVLPEGVLASAIAAGESHCAILDTNGQVYSFGSNLQEQLGYESDGDLVSTPQKVSIPMESSAKSVFLDTCHHNTAVVDSNGFVWTWGDNSTGQLGNNSSVSSSLPVGVVDENGSGRLCLGKAPRTETYNATITVNATVPAPTYAIQIPTTVSIGELKQTEEKPDGSHVVSSEIKITVSDVDHLFNEKLILVTVNTESGKFELADGDHRLPYAVYGSLSDLPLKPGDEFAIFMKDQTATGRIEFDRSLITREGSYSGRLLFEVSVNDLTID